MGGRLSRSLALGSFYRVSALARIRKARTQASRTAHMQRNGTAMVRSRSGDGRDAVYTRPTNSGPGGTMQAFWTSLAAAWLAALAAPAQAHDWPAKPVKIVVPFA